MASALSISWHDLLRNFHGWIYLLKWPLAFVAGWTSIYIRRWRKNRDENAAQGWPSVEGLIISAEATRIAKTSRFIVTLKYSYFLTEYHYGEYIHDFANEVDAKEFASQLRNKRIQVRYNQSKPNKSVLEQRTIEQYILLTPRFG
ncbi:MAG: DUF3592 domain-containing protein [Acidobacteriaceae bacterium]|jgi:hypothetical protein